MAVCLDNDKLVLRTKLTEECVEWNMKFAAEGMTEKQFSDAPDARQMFNTTPILMLCNSLFTSGLGGEH